MAKRSVIKPGAKAETKPRTLASGRRAISAAKPIEEGGEENLSGVELSELSAEFIDLEEQIQQLEENKKELEKRQGLREEMIIERMQAAKMQKQTLRGRTLYLSEDLIVSKAKGVTPDQLAMVLRSVGLSDLIGETIPAQSLKATIKGYRVAAIEQEKTGEQAYCRHCMAFHPAGLAGNDCPDCFSAMNPPGQNPRLVRVVDGVFAELAPLLYVQPKTKLGCRKAD